MRIKAILFDLYGTLIDIETDESMEKIYRGISRFLIYQGINLHWQNLRDLYYGILQEQRQASSEQHPEIDVEAIWDTLLARQDLASKSKRRDLKVYLAQLYRGLSLKRLRRFPHVKRVLNTLRLSYRMAIVSDAQACFARAEIGTAKLGATFDPVIISAEYGFRKPDPRMIRLALDQLRLTPGEVIFVGNDMYRDIYCAQQLGIKTVFFASTSGDPSYNQIVPDYRITRFKDLLPAVEAIVRK